MKSTLFLNNLTQVDFAYIDPNRYHVPTGGSFSVDAHVTGEIDDHEAVVVDFGTLKRDIKRLIDDHKGHGFDHKLWCYEFGDGKVETIGEDRVKVRFNEESFVCEVPRDCVRIAEPMTPGVNITKYLNEELNNLYPDSDISVKVTVSNKFVPPPDCHYDHLQPFRYTHGLKNSSSYGCQNIAHGHLSYYCFINDAGSIKLNNHYTSIIDDYIQNAVFIWSDNVKHNTDTHVIIEYTCERGLLTAAYSKEKNNIIIIDTETTIENLVAFLAYKLDVVIRSLKKTMGVHGLYVSEGITKGAYIQL